MTGFGEASAQVDGAHYFLEVRSLNNKYFKATIRLPEEFQGLEAELEAELRRRLVRGTITLIAKASDTSGGAAHDINHHALGRYIEQIKKTPQVQSGAVSIDIAALLALPGVLQPPPDEEQRLTGARAAYMGLLDKAIASLLDMRVKEGKALVSDLMHQHAVIVKHLGVIAGRAPEVVAEYQKRLQARIEQLLQSAQVRVEPSELLKEVAVFAERSDIAEEIARLTGHMEQFQSLLQEKDSRPVGRTLDFLTQEMLREANTIASKSGDSTISRHIVEVKGAIDRIKEQVQNAE